MQRPLSATRAQSAKPQHQVAEAVQCRDGWPKQEAEQAQRSGDRKRRPLSALERKAFRGQFAQNDVQHRYDDERNGDGHSMRAGGRDRSDKSAEKRLDKVRQRGLANPAQSERRNSDAQLGRREIGVEAVDGMLENRRVAAAGSDQLCHPASPDRHEGKLGGNKKSVGCNQDKDCRDAEQVGHTAIAARHDLLFRVHFSGTFGLRARLDG